MLHVARRLMPDELLYIDRLEKNIPTLPLLSAILGQKTLSLVAN